MYFRAFALVLLIQLTTSQVFQGLEDGAIYKIVSSEGYILQAQPRDVQLYLDPVLLVEEPLNLTKFEQWQFINETHPPYEPYPYPNPWFIQNVGNTFNKVSQYIVQGPCCINRDQDWSVVQPKTDTNLFHLGLITHFRDGNQNDNQNSINVGFCLQNNGLGNETSTWYCDEENHIQDWSFIKIE